MPAFEAAGLLEQNLCPVSLLLLLLLAALLSLLPDGWRYLPMEFDLPTEPVGPVLGRLMSPVAAQWEADLEEAAEGAAPPQ